MDRVARWASIILFAMVAVASPCVGTAGKAKLKGKIEKGIYTSGRKLFRVEVPQAGNWAGVPFRASDFSETGKNEFDAVVFEVSDFGERLVACGRPMPPDVAASYAQNDSMPLTALVRMALQNLGHQPEALTVLSESPLPSDGEAAKIFVFRSSKGSILAQSTGGGKPEPFDAVLAVAATVRRGTFLYAIGQNDGGSMSQDEGTKAKELEAAVRAFFGSLELVEKR